MQQSIHCLSEASVSNRCPPCVAQRPSARPASRRCTIVSQAQDGGGGLFSGFGKLFQGESKQEEQNAPSASQATVEKSMRPEMFMNGGTDEKPEYPPFQVIARANEYTLRFYDVYPVIEMEYEQRQEGYAALGSFIDGENQGQVRFVYTQPVTMKYPGNTRGSKVMQMYLGSRRDGQDSTSVAALPAPTDPSVRVSIAGGELLATTLFEGYITPTSAESARQALLAALKRDGIKLSEEAEAGAFRVGQFGAVYQLSGRINELYVKVVL